NIIFYSFQAQDSAVLIQSNFHLRKIQFQGAVLESGPAQALRQSVGLMKHLLDRLGGVSSQDGQRFFVSETPFGADYRWIKSAVQDFAFSGEEELNALRKPIHARFERTEFVAEHFWQHGDDAIHQVSGISPPPRLGIEGV